MHVSALLNGPPLTPTHPLLLPPLLPRPAPEPIFPSAEDDESSDSGRANAYTTADDLVILKVVGAYYGTTFCGKIPWSFWSTFKRVTGSKRSTSSLYHHWNCAIKKKYEMFLSVGRISDCIFWLETVGEDRAPGAFVPTGAPLRHYRSEPPVPLDGEARRGAVPNALVRTTSVSTGAPALFLRLP
jgi:hypothetical protein